MDDVLPRGLGVSVAGKLAVGMTAAYRHVVTGADVQAFANLSGDRNPLHLDEEFARTTRFKGRIAHGMLSASFFSTVLANTLPGPGTIYLSQSLFFRAPVRIGDEVEARVTVAELIGDRGRVLWKTVAPVGDTVVVAGEAMVLVPPRG